MRSLLAGVTRRPTVQNLVRSPRVSTFFRSPPLSMDGAERYAGDSTLFPIVSSLAQDTGAVEFKLYTPDASGKDEDRTEVLPGKHPAVDLFLNPNPFYSRAEFVELAQQWIDLVGECIILVERVGSMPVRMWVIDPSKVTPKTAPILNAPVTKKFLMGWIYTAEDGTQIDLTTRDVLQIKLPNPRDPWRGIGPVQSALVDIDSSRYSAEWNRMFFVNGASPDGVIQVEESLSDDDFDEMSKRWRESHQGIGNAHRVAILENNAQWVPNAFTHRDMMFQELREQSSDFIRKAFRYPKTMLGDTDTANRAVAEAGEYVYGKWLITPRANRWVAMLNNRLMPLFGENSRGLTWDFEPVVEDDDQAEAVTIQTRASAVQTFIQTGFDAEEALATAGLPPMQWKKPQQPGFDEDGKPFPKPGETNEDAQGAPRTVRRDGTKREEPGESSSGS